MTKLYKYRPLSDFLFKELYYQELYFASYSELNDPLDLSARLEFTPNHVNEIGSLLWFLFKTTFKMPDVELSERDISNNHNLLNFNHNENSQKKYKLEIFNALTALASEKDFVSIEDLEAILLSIRLPFKPDLPSLNNEFKRLTRKFLENSYTTCFSEENNDFLMWSHYASKHSGICLEFTLENKGLFPFVISNKRKGNKEEYLKRISKWNMEQTIIWENLKKVSYQEKQPHINFFDFLPVFHNEHDCDLIALSKGWAHQYAFKLKRVFATKTLPWKYEQEWRVIEINFDNEKYPEERIMHYPIECLNAIYFGIRTPENVKNRIYKIFNETFRHEINYYDCVPTAGRELTFNKWEYIEN